MASVPQAAIWAFCALIICSRIGLWMFDMAHAQILQQHVPMKEMSTVRVASLWLAIVHPLAQGKGSRNIPGALLHNVLGNEFVWERQRQF